MGKGDGGALKGSPKKGAGQAGWPGLERHIYVDADGKNEKKTCDMAGERI